MNRDRIDKVLMSALGKLREDYLAEIESVSPVDVESLQSISTKLWALREIRHDIEQAIQQIDEV